MFAGIPPWQKLLDFPIKALSAEKQALEYGGLGFSAIGHARAITRIASRSVTAAVTVMVPKARHQ